MIHNRAISLDVLAAAVCWLGGTLLVIGDAFDILPDESAFVGIASIAFGHLISVHMLVCKMERRERDAFDVGREAGLRSMRRVD